MTLRILVFVAPFLFFTFTNCGTNKSKIGVDASIIPPSTSPKVSVQISGRVNPALNNPVYLNEATPFEVAVYGAASFRILNESNLPLTGDMTPLPNA